MTLRLWPWPYSTKGQIHVTDYNSWPIYHRNFKISSYYSLWKALSSVTLTLKFDLDLTQTKGQIHVTEYNFWPIYYRHFKISSYYSFWKALSFVNLTLKFDLELNQTKGQIHVTDYSFWPICHRHFKISSYYSLWKALSSVTLTLKFDLEVERYMSFLYLICTNWRRYFELYECSSSLFLIFFLREVFGWEKDKFRPQGQIPMSRS